MFEVKLNVLSLCLFIGPSMVTAGPFTDVKNLYAKNEPGINSVEGKGFFSEHFPTSFKLSTYVK